MEEKRYLPSQKPSQMQHGLVTIAFNKDITCIPRFTPLKIASAQTGHDETHDEIEKSLIEENEINVSWSTRDGCTEQTTKGVLVYLEKSGRLTFPKSQLKPQKKRKKTPKIYFI